MDRPKKYEKSWFLVCVAVLAVVLAAGAVSVRLTLPNLVPEDKLRRAFADHVANWSNGEFHLPDGAEVSLGRGPVMTVENAEFSGNLGGAEWELGVASLSATLMMLPLLQGKVEIKSLALDSPHLRVRDHVGPAVATWGKLSTEVRDRTSPAGEVIVTNGSFAYETAAGRRLGGGSIDLRIVARPDSPAVLLTGAFPAGEGRLHVRGQLEDVDAAFSGSGSHGRLALRSAANADEAGTPPPQPKADVPGAAREGELVSAIRRVATAVGLARTGPVALEGRFVATPWAFELADATVSFGGLLAEGDMAIALTGDEAPFDQLEGVIRGATDAWRNAATALKAGAWRDVPVKLDWLAPLDIELAARLPEVRFAGRRIEARRIRLRSIDGAVRLEVTATGDLGGQRGELAFSDVSENSPPHVSVNGRLEDVELRETGSVLLSWLPPPLVSPPQLPEGKLDAELAVASQGETLGEIVSGLDGVLSMEASNGNLSGADVALTLESLADGREIMTEQDGPLIPAPGRTEFDTAKMRIDFVEGAARLGDTRIRGKRYAIDMGGEVDLEVGEIHAEGRARLHSDDAGEAPPVVDLPFGVGGTVSAAVVAAGVPRRDYQPETEAIAEGDSQ